MVADRHQRGPGDAQIEALSSTPLVAGARQRWMDDRPVAAGHNGVKTRAEAAEAKAAELQHIVDRDLADLQAIVFALLEQIRPADSEAAPEPRRTSPASPGPAAETVRAMSDPDSLRLDTDDLRRLKNCARRLRTTCSPPSGTSLARRMRARSTTWRYS